MCWSVKLRKLPVTVQLPVLVCLYYSNWMVPFFCMILNTICRQDYLFATVHKHFCINYFSSKIFSLFKLIEGQNILTSCFMYEGCEFCCPWDSVSTRNVQKTHLHNLICMNAEYMKPRNNKYMARALKFLMLKMGHFNSLTKEFICRRRFSHALFKYFIYFTGHYMLFSKLLYARSKSYSRSLLFYMNWLT